MDTSLLNIKLIRERLPHQGRSLLLMLYILTLSKVSL